MKTQAQAMQDFADVLAEELAIASKLAPLEAAQRAWHPGGPPVKDLALRIEADRAEAKLQAAA